MSNTANIDTKDPNFQKIVCRRIPIKLQQFARLLTEVTSTDIDPVRIKAMESQIRKTKQICDDYQIETTSTLLSHIQSQLKLDADTLDSQRPLINRFIQRLESHAERLKLGQINPGSHQAVKQAQQQQKESKLHKEVAAAGENHSTETDVADSNANSALTQHAQNEQVTSDEAALKQENTPTQEHPLKQETHHKESALKKIDSVQQASSLYEFQHTVVSSQMSSANDLLDKSSEITIYWSIQEEHIHANTRSMLADFGYEIISTDITSAINEANNNTLKIVIAKLEDFPDAIEAPLSETCQLIVLAETDTLESRLKGIRLGSTLFLAKPIDTSKLLHFIDTLEQQGNSTPFRIAVMEDSKAQAKFIDKILSGAGFEACVNQEPLELLNALSNFDPEVIFMDMQMPDCNGVELTKVLRQIERFSTIPIVFLSAEENPEKQREAMTSGGTAFIAKPVNKEQMLFVAELYARRTRNLQPLLARDFQTGLNSTALLKEQLNIETERAMRQNSSMFLAFIEINQLSSINTEYGYAFGERVLQQLARLLRQRLRKTDCIGFFDTQKIGVILTNCNDAEAEAVMAYLTQSFSNTSIAHESGNVSVSLSVGLSKLGGDYDVQRLVKRTLAALEQAHSRTDTHLIWAHEAR